MAGEQRRDVRSARRRRARQVEVTRAVDSRRIGLDRHQPGRLDRALAASRSPHVAFVVTISGPAVSVGEEIAYSRLAGADPGSEQGLTDEEIEKRMREFNGPHGYDPAATLAVLDVPSVWLLGEKDRSIPLHKTAVALGSDSPSIENGLITAHHRQPGLDHGLRSIVHEQPDFSGL